MKKIFYLLACLLLSFFFLGGEASAKEAECQVDYGSPSYRTLTMLEAAIMRTPPPGSRYLVFVYPYRFIHKGVVPEEYKKMDSMEMVRSDATDKDIEGFIKNREPQMKKKIQELFDKEEENCK